MNFKELIEKSKEAMIQDLVRLLQFDTVLIEQPQSKDAPFGEGIRDALLYVLDLGKQMGFETLNVDNIAGHIEYGEGEEVIGVLCHIDVVPAGGGWKYPPFSGTIEDDKLYARGALDDKGPLMSSLYALKALKDSGLKVNKKIRLIVGTDEETDWRGITRYLEVCKMPDMAFSPDAQFPLIYGEKGIMSIDLTCDYQSKDLLQLISGDRYNVVPEKAVALVKGVHLEDYEAYIKEKKLRGEFEQMQEASEVVLYGVGAHAMEPDDGVNALVHLSTFLSDQIDHPLVSFVGKHLTDSRFRSLGLDFSDPEMKDLTVNVAVAKIDGKSGLVGLNLRYPINWDKDAFVEAFRKEASKYQVQVTVTKDSKPHYVDRKSELVRKLHVAYMKHTGDIGSPLLTIGGGTYARALKNAVAFGMLMPGREDVVHQVDEYIYISDLVTSTLIFAEAMYSLGK